MTIKEVIKSIFLAQANSISSKRVCGVLGWIICMGILIYCTLMEIQAPVMVDSVIIGSTALLGVDSITNIWKHPNTPNRRDDRDDVNFNFKQQ